MTSTHELAAALGWHTSESRQSEIAAIHKVIIEDTALLKTLALDGFGIAPIFEASFEQGNP